MERIQYLEMLEAILAQQRAFGDSDYINEQLQVSYKRRLHKISSHLPVAGQLLDALHRANSYSQYRVIGDTVVRCAINHAFTQLETGSPYGLPPDECEEVFRETIRHLEEGKNGGPLESGVKQVNRLGSEPYHGWVWSEEHSDDVFGRAFRYVIQENYGESSLCTPNADELAMLVKGTQLLGELLPLLSPSALSHAHLIAIFPVVGNWKGMASSSQFRVGGTIFLNRELLQNPGTVAEHLFHEALHQKLYDFSYGHSLLEPGWVRKHAPRVCSLWNIPGLNQSNYWDVHRSVAAFHVYVHLSLLCTLAEQRVSELERVYGSGSLTMTGSCKTMERAHYLGEQIKELCWQELGLAGKGFIDWLISVLDALDPTPPPKGSYLHLVLDRYQREARKVELLLSETNSDSFKREAAVFSDLPQRLMWLSKDELESTREVLSTMNAETDLNRFNTALAQFPDEELGTKFPQVRRLISKTLLDLSPDGYTLKRSSSEPRNPDEIVKQMVERSSRRLDTSFASVPSAVEAALYRAEELRFARSSADPVGRLLAVLAATVPLGGRVLEVGTGAGVGTAWITIGLGARIDVELISVERNHQLSEAVQTWPWPSYVQIVTADVSEVLDQLGMFDLVFADTRPSWYGGIERVVAALRPRGLLLIDDLRQHSDDLDREQPEDDRLRRSLFGHPDLQVVELEWSSGIILAVRRTSTIE